MQRQHENTLYSHNISVQIFNQERFGCAEGVNERDYTFRKIGMWRSAKEQTRRRRRRRNALAAGFRGRIARAISAKNREGDFTREKTLPRLREDLRGKKQS